VRGRIEKILSGPKRTNTATEKIQPAGATPRPVAAAFRGEKVKHHPALPHAELPTFMERLRQVEGTAARALEFAILTGAHTEEVIFARPVEINER
jgi:integrase